MSVKFEKLFSPIKIGPIDVRNRIVMPPMQTGYVARDGSVTDRLITYLEEKAKGGAGLVISEFAHVDNKGSKYSYCQLAIYDDSFIYGLNNLAEAIQAHGAKAGVQITHCGRYNLIKRAYPTVAPSSIRSEFGVETPKELTVDEVGEIVNAFGEATRRARQADFDLVEIDGAHGYLITQFLSPLTNKRMDNYGGSLENRMRFALEVTERVKEKAGSDLGVSFRMSGDEYVEGGITLEESRKTAKELEKKGVDVLNVSGGVRETADWAVPPMYLPRGCHLHLAEGIKKVVSVPVIVVGAINDPLFAEQILRDGKADMVAMARALVADPFLPRKAMEGRLEDIRKCIRCNDGCSLRSYELKDIWCTVNAASGREAERFVRAEKPKSVLVAGGGPAGMEAARVAALRGHKVVLYEKENMLGGYLVVSSIPKFKKEIKSLVEYLTTQLKKLDVEVVLKKEVDSKVVEERKPDVIIVATGSKPVIPEIPGIDKPLVATAVDVLIGKAKVGEKVLVIGAGLTGSETAWFLAEQGKKVKVVRRKLLPIAEDADPGVRAVLERKFREYNIEFMPGLKLEKITDKGAVLMDREWRRHVIEADNVVLALGFKPRRELYEDLRGKHPEVYAIGDCVKPRRIMNAIHESFNVAREI